MTVVSLKTRFCGVHVVFPRLPSTLEDRNEGMRDDSQYDSNITKYKNIVSRTQPTFILV